MRVQKKGSATFLIVCFGLCLIKSTPISRNVVFSNNGSYTNFERRGESATLGEMTFILSALLTLPSLFFLLLTSLSDDI
jgi:hypothetical protein